MPFTSMTRDVPATRRSRVWRRIALLAFAALWASVAYWQVNKPLPAGSHVQSGWYPVGQQEIGFIADVTSADAYGRPTVSQAIFDEELGLVRSARRLVILDYCLFNGRRPASEAAGPPLRSLSGELRDALIERRRAQPDLQVLFITDPVNDAYGDAPSRDLQLLRAAGVSVAVTRLNALRDSNFIYSSLWRLLIGWWSGEGRRAGARGEANTGADWLPSPLDEGRSAMTLGGWARLVNFKANQRKVIIADDGRDGLVAIVGSANPHDASSAHSNTALKIAGPVVLPLLESHRTLLRLEG